jgi:acyl carrier protein
VAGPSVDWSALVIENPVEPELVAVFRTVFNDDTLDLTRGTTARDVKGWDSLRHLRLILAVEQTFKVRLPSTKVSNLKNVGDLADLIERTRATRGRG